MKKTIIFTKDEFYKNIKNNLNEKMEICTNVEIEKVDGEEVEVDYLILTFAKINEKIINKIKKITQYYKINKNVISIELTDLIGFLSKKYNVNLIEKVDFFEANFDNNFKEYISFDLA